MRARRPARKRRERSAGNIILFRIIGFVDKQIGRDTDGETTAVGLKASNVIARPEGPGTQSKNINLRSVGGCYDISYKILR